MLNGKNMFNLFLSFSFILEPKTGNSFPSPNKNENVSPAVQLKVLF